MPGWETCGSLTPTHQTREQVPTSIPAPAYVRNECSEKSIGLVHKGWCRSQDYITSYTKTRHFYKLTRTDFQVPLQNLRCVCVSMTDQHVSHQHEVRRVKSVPGMWVPHLVEPVKIGVSVSQLCTGRGRGAFSDFLWEGVSCAGELLPLVGQELLGLLRREQACSCWAGNWAASGRQTDPPGKQPTL